MDDLTFRLIPNRPYGEAKGLSPEIIRFDFPLNPNHMFCGMAFGLSQE
jgi:hypothetical protein